METGYWSRLLPAVPALVLFFWGLTIPGGRLALGAGGPLLGGPCEYKNYPGRAQIISIQPNIDPGAPGIMYEVTFSFQSYDNIIESHAKPDGRVFFLTMKNGGNLSRHFLDKYRIEAGRFFECTLKVITRGTCTPTLFEFPGIDLNDYENR